MAAEFFLNFLEQFNFWLWVLFGVIMFTTLAVNKGWKRFYFLIVIVGFLAVNKFIEHFYVAMAIIFVWLLFMRLEFFVSRWVLISAVAVLLFFGLNNPFFYLTVFALWVIMIWHFVNATFGALDSKTESK